MKTAEEKKKTKIEYNKRWRDKNKGYGKKWRKENPDYAKEWKDENPDYFSVYKSENKEIAADYHRDWISEKRKVTPDYEKKSRKKYVDKINNLPEDIKKQKLQHKNKLHREWKSKRRYSNPMFRLKINTRCLLRMAVKNKGFSKTSKTLSMLGCSYDEFRAHLEKQFEPWMSWDNYGRYKKDGERTWNIDHIYPSSLAESEEELIKLNHYTNLRPLCSRENGNKSNKLI